MLAAPATPAARVADGRCPFKGLASFEPRRRRLLLRPGAARRRARRARRRRRLPRHHRPLRQRQVVGPAGRSPPRPRLRRAAGQRAAGGACCCGPASGRSTSFAACSCRARRIRSPRPWMRCRPVDGSCSRSTSWRSCSPRAALTTSAPHSSTHSPARPPTRRVARSWWSRCARTSTGGSPPTPPCRAAGRQPRARRADAGLGAAASRRAARRPGGPAGGARADGRAGGRRRGRAGCAAAAVDRSARALAEAPGQHARRGRLPRVGRRPGRCRAAGRGHVRAHPRRVQASRARDHAAAGGRERERRLVRRRAPLAELDLERNPDAADVLATLADSRLVTVGEGSVEVAHEALLREWPRLRAWIAEDAEWRRLRHHITQAATEWQASGRDPGELYRGARLAAALDWAADHALDLNELEREFVTESREVSEQETKRARRTNRRLRALLAGVAVLLVAAVAGGILARRPARRGARRGDGPARPAARGGGARRRGPRSVAAARAPGGRDRRLAADAQLPAGRPAARAGDRRRHARRWRPPPRECGESRREDARRGRLRDRAPVLRHPDVRADRRAAAGDLLELAIGLRVGGDHRVQPRRAHHRARWKRLHPPARREDAHAAARPPIHGDSVTRIAFTRGGAQLVAVVVRSCRESWVTIRRTATLEPIGAAIAHDVFKGSFLGQFCSTPSMALTSDGRSLVTTSRTASSPGGISRAAGRLRTVGIENGHHALALSPDGRTLAVGIDRGIQLVDARSGAVRATSRGLAGGLDLAPLQPGRPDGRIDEPRRDGDALGPPVCNPPRDVARTLGGRPAARLQPRR